jgi:hypothetical protein
MICRYCAQGGDLKTELRSVATLTGRAGNARRQGLTTRINKAHGRCRGGTWCDCHHAGTPYERKAVSTPVSKITAPTTSATPDRRRPRRG